MKQDFGDKICIYEEYSNFVNALRTLRKNKGWQSRTAIACIRYNKWLDCCEPYYSSMRICPSFEI